MRLREVATLSEKAARFDMFVTRQEFADVTSSIRSDARAWRDGLTEIVGEAKLNEVANAAELIKLDMAQLRNSDEVSATPVHLSNTSTPSKQNFPSHMDDAHTLLRPDLVTPEGLKGGNHALREELACSPGGAHEPLKEEIRMLRGRAVAIGATQATDKVMHELRQELSEAIEQLRSPILQLERQCENAVASAAESRHKIDSFNGMVASLQSSLSSTYVTRPELDNVVAAVKRELELVDEATRTFRPSSLQQYGSSEIVPTQHGLVEGIGELTSRTQELQSLVEKMRQDTVTRREYAESVDHLSWKLASIEGMATRGDRAAERLEDQERGVGRLWDRVEALDTEMVDIRRLVFDSSASASTAQRQLQRSPPPDPAHMAACRAIVNRAILAGGSAALQRDNDSTVASYGPACRATSDVGRTAAEAEAVDEVVDEADHALTIGVTSVAQQECGQRPHMSPEEAEACRRVVDHVIASGLAASEDRDRRGDASPSWHGARHRLIHDELLTSTVGNQPSTNGAVPYASTGDHPYVSGGSQPCVSDGRAPSRGVARRLTDSGIAYFTTSQLTSPADATRPHRRCGSLELSSFTLDDPSLDGSCHFIADDCGSLMGDTLRESLTDDGRISSSLAVSRLTFDDCASLGHGPESPSPWASSLRSDDVAAVLAGRQISLGSGARPFSELAGFRGEGRASPSGVSHGLSADDQ